MSQKSTDAGDNVMLKEPTIDELRKELLSTQSQLKRVIDRYERAIFLRASSIFVLGQGPKWLRWIFNTHIYFCTQLPVWRHRVKVTTSLTRNLVWFLPKYFYLKVRGVKCIAIFRLWRLGDIICCEPIVRELRRQNPRAFLVWFVEKSYLELVASMGSTDCAVAVVCYSECEWLEKFHLFDRVVNIMLPNRRCLACGVKLEHMPDFPLSLDNYLLEERSLAEVFSKLSGIQCADMQPRISIPASARTVVDSLELPSAYIVLHTIPRDVTRSWPNSKWNELASRLISLWKLPIIEVGFTPSLLKYLPITNVKNTVPAHGSMIYSSCGLLSLLETAEVIRRSTLFIDTDSGPAHFANSFKVSGVILLGRYLKFASYNPYSGYYAKEHANLRVIRCPGKVSEISVEEVLEGVLSVMKNKEYVSESGNSVEYQ